MRALASAASAESSGIGYCRFHCSSLGSTAAAAVSVAAPVSVVAAGRCCLASGGDDDAAAASHARRRVDAEGASEAVARVTAMVTAV